MRKFWECRLWAVVLLMVCGVGLGSLAMAEDTVAIASRDDILKLAEVQGVYSCYVGNKIRPSVNKASFSGINSVLYNGAGRSQSVYLPTGFVNDGNNAVTCKVLFNNSGKGLPKVGYSAPSSAAGLGYTANGNKWEFSNAKTAAATAVKNITGGGAIGAGKVVNINGGKLYQWDNKSKYALYYYYLENLNNGGIIQQGSCGSTKPSGYTYYYKKSKNEWCGIKVNGAITTPLIVPTEPGYQMKAGTLRTVLMFLNQQGSYGGFNDSDYIGNAASLTVAEGAGETEGEEENKDSSEMCYEAGVVSQSWFLCPAIENMSSFANGVDNLISGWLSVDPELYDNSSSAYTMWEIMRNIANIAMVLVLLAVIVSQLTGWGIDNYGIKKILPRLIAMAIVVNLSFIACQLVIDVSNILGDSLKNLFEGIGIGLVGGNTAELNDFIPGMITGILTAVTAVGGGAGIAITAGTAALSGMGPMAVLLIVLALLSIVIAVLLFFLMLGARMVLVILCTAVAPVVAVLYILPNTQNWAKKWWRVFWAMLVMYPLCGAVLGISTLIKGMVVGSSGIELWMAVVGMVGPFLPFFMLPSMLRGAISMLGSVGAAMVAAGQGLRRNAGNLASTIQGTAAAQNQMALGRANLNRKLAGIGSDGKLTARGQNLLNRAKSNPNSARSRMLAARYRTAMKDQKEMGGNENLFSGGLASAMADIDAKNRDEAVGQRLSLMMSTGEGGGIWLDNGKDEKGNVKKKRASYTLENMKTRMNQLKDTARGRELNETEIMEMRALARGMTAEPGGAGMLGKMVRNIDHDNDTFSEGFVRQLADIYQQDSGVRGKMKEKDSGSGVYLEDFMEGGRYTGGNAQAAVDFSTYTAGGETGARYKDQLKQRLKTASAGLGQGGTGIKEYLGMVENGDFVDGFDKMSEDDKKQAVRKQYQDILDDADLMNSLAKDDRATVEAAAENKGVVGRSTQRVEVVGGAVAGATTLAAGGANVGGGGFVSEDGSQLKIDHREARQGVDVPTQGQSGQPSQSQASGRRIITNASENDFRAARDADKRNNPGSTMYGR